MSKERFPEDTATVKYMPSSHEEELSLYELMEWAERYFPDADPRDVLISHEEIQFRCFGYDLYDSSDWRHYWVFRRID